MVRKRVLSVGQCPADDSGIRRVVQQSFDAEVIAVDSAEEARQQLQQGGFALVLVNRIFDADGDSGLDLIRSLRDDPALVATPIMLVSNFDDAQTQAVAAGALPGFGKAALGQPAMLGRLRAILDG